MSTKIPKQLYVTSKIVKEKEWIWDRVTDAWKDTPETSYIFGFLHPHEPHLKPDGARKKTQNEWAYCELACIEQDPQTLRISGRTKLMHPTAGMYLIGPTNDLGKPFSAEILLSVMAEVEEEVQPRVWDNVPLSGFEIIDTVNRYRGNKLFKVKDPRGVVFEVTVAALFEIISRGTIINGVIQNECIWKANKNLVLV